MSTTAKTRTLCARDIMTRDPVCVMGGDSLRELARIFDANGISGAPVIDAQGRLIGVVSKTDVLHRALEGPLGSRPGSFFEGIAEGFGSGTGIDPEDLGVVDEFMTTDLITAQPDETVTTIAHRMAREGVHRIIVIDPGNHPIGIVTALDVLKVFP
jgi:CBS domain-containing protein